MTDRRVVVTGLGTVNPVGGDTDATWAALLAGTSGIGPITSIEVSDLRTRIGGEVDGFDIEEHVPRRQARRMDRFGQLFWAAAHEALDDAGIAYDEDDPAAKRAGVAVGTGIGGIETLEQEIGILADVGPHRLNPFGIPKIIANMAGGQASIDFHLYGPNTTAVTACAASANAIGDAAAIISRGAADVMLAGGAEAAFTRFTIGGFSQGRALSTRNDDPERASRPFDVDRDGFVLSEGAAALVLEERDHALARGATAYAEVVGYGMSSDGYHVTLPRPGGDGAARAMQAAIDDARITAAEVSYVNAHGTSTAANDVTETMAIKAVFGDIAHAVPISSTKSMTGHLLGGAGALEALVSALSIRDGVVPPTINLEHPDAECDLDYVPGVAREVDVRYAMTNSFGFGGHNVVLVLARP